MECFKFWESLTYEVILTFLCRPLISQTFPQLSCTARKGPNSPKAVSNQTPVTEFVLQGFSEVPRFQILLFILFLCLYAGALCGNSLLVVAVTRSSRPHSPVYFFLVSLSVLDLVCACTVVPKLLEILVAEKRGISYGGCMAQMCFLSWAVPGEVLLFTATA